MALVQAVLEGRFSVSAIYRDRLATCTGCLACESVCPSGVPVTEIIQAAKEEAFGLEGRGLLRRMVSTSLSDYRFMRALAWLAPVVLHYAGRSLRGGAQAERGRSLLRNPDTGTRTKDERRGRIAFYPGCAVTYFQQDIERATVSVLQALGYEVIVPEGIGCCGRPHLGLGDRPAAEARARRNAAVLSSLGAETVVTACASCGLTFKKEYPTLLAPSGLRPPQVQDIHEFLAGKLELSGAAAAVWGKATWHDPCHLGRGQGLSRMAREVLHSVPGMELREMEFPDRCCGFGGTMRIGHHGLSDRIGEAKAADIVATGASLVITGCPGCRMQIAGSLRRAGSDASVVHTMQVLETALRSSNRERQGFKLQTKG